MAVHTTGNKHQMDMSSATGTVLTSNLLPTTERTLSTGNFDHSSNSNLESKQIQVPIQFVQSAQSGKVKPVTAPLVRLIRTPNKANVANSSVVKVKAPAPSPIKGPQPTLIITTPAKLLQHGAGATKLKVGDTITIPKSSLIPDTVAQSNSVGVLPHTEVLSTPTKVIQFTDSSSHSHAPILISRAAPVNQTVTSTHPSVDSSVILTQQLVSQPPPVQLTTISPAWQQSPLRSKRPSVFNDTSHTSETKRRRTPNSEKGSKGLRHFAMLVCEKVKQKGTTTYNEVADELVAEYGETHRINMAEQQYDQKNIRRRVYDALNVLMAMNIIFKDKKDINWLGFPTDSAQELQSLQNEKRTRELRIEEKTGQLRELILQQIAFKNLVQRNKRVQDTQGPPEESSFIQLPFIIVNTSKKTVIDCSISNDKYEYMFNFDNTFEIHDDIEVLKRMGMAYGLESGSCSVENVKTAKSLLPPVLKPYVDEMASPHSSTNKLFTNYSLQDKGIPKKVDADSVELGSCFSMEQVLDPDDQEVAMVTDVGQDGEQLIESSTRLLSRSSSGHNSAMYSLTPMSSAGSESRGSTPFDAFDS